MVLQTNIFIPSGIGCNKFSCSYLSKSFDAFRSTNWWDIILLPMPKNCSSNDETTGSSGDIKSTTFASIEVDQSSEVQSLTRSDIEKDVMHDLHLTDNEIHKELVTMKLCLLAMLGLMTIVLCLTFLKTMCKKFTAKRNKTNGFSRKDDTESCNAVGNHSYEVIGFNKGQTISFK